MGRRSSKETSASIATKANIENRGPVADNAYEADDSADTTVDPGSTTKNSSDMLRDAALYDKGHLRSSPAEDMSSKGLEILGREVKELLQAIQKLRHIGIEDFVIPLPKIAVVGGQSAGKSSLIEGISEIKVPRKSGTCTRCPLEINLSENSEINAEWLCKISLFKKYLYEPLKTGKHSKVEGATRARPLGPWIPQDSEDIHFTTINSKEEIANMLHLAQLATLNPGQTPEAYLPGNNSDSHMQVKFSPNVIRLDISGPGLPNLSFYDLPGVISNTETDDEHHLVILVKNLVLEYIKSQTCVILLALPMTEDPANSMALDLIRKAKAESRTLGVLTKPDRVQEGESLSQWIEILEGRSFRLGFDYHIVKNNPDPYVDHTTARAEETSFFSETKPWNTDLYRYSNRFGTLRLQTFLSQKLTAQIKASLPQIIQQVERKSVVIDDELRSLPEPFSGDELMKVLQKILEFDNEMKCQIDGGSPYYPFQKILKNLIDEFRNKVEKSHPILLMPESNHVARGSSPIDQHGTPTPIRQTTIFLDSEDESGNLSKNPQKRNRSGEPSSSKKRRTENIPWYTADDPKQSSKRFTLDQIREIIHDAYIGPTEQVDPRATDQMILLSLQHWEKLLNWFMNKTDTVCRDLIHSQLSKTFGCWQQTSIFTRLLDICNSFFSEHMTQQRHFGERALYLETYKPVALNSMAMQTATHKARLYIQSRRRVWRAEDLLDSQEDKRAKKTQMTREERIEKITDDQLGPDPYQKEVEQMGHVRGYYEYASSRFVDVVCQGIVAELLPSCGSGIGAIMQKEIGLDQPDAHERCALLLEIDPENRARRVRLVKKKATILKAQNWLKGLTGDEPDAMDTQSV